MNTKGFTLVELIAVIVILSLLALITSTAVTKLVSDAKDDLSQTQIALIKSAAETWMADNLTHLPDTGECSYLTLEDLKNYGLLDSNVLDPKNNQEISDNLKIKISTTLSKYGNPIRNVEVNPKNVEGCNKIYELINQKIVNGYANAIKDTIDKYQLNGNSITTGSYTSSEDGKTLSKEGVEPPITVDYDKNVYCEIIEIYNDGNIYLEGCSVNGSDNKYTYGTPQTLIPDEPSDGGGDNEDVCTNYVETCTNYENVCDDYSQARFSLTRENTGGLSYSDFVLNEEQKAIINEYGDYCLYESGCSFDSYSYSIRCEGVRGTISVECRKPLCHTECTNMELVCVE